MKEWSIEMYLDGSIKNIDAILSKQNEEKEKRHLLNIYTNITWYQIKLCPLMTAFNHLKPDNKSPIIV